MMMQRIVKSVALAAILTANVSAWGQNAFCTEYLSLPPGAGTIGAAYDMDRSLDNRLLLTGRTSHTVGPMDDFYMAKVNPLNGSLLGLSQFGSAFDDRALSCVATADGGVITVGYGWQEMSEWDRVTGGIPLNTGNSTFSIVKLNSDGSVGWERHLDIGDYDDMAFNVIEKSDGTFLVIGRSHFSGGKYITLVNVNLAGAILDVFSYNQIFVGGEELYGVDILEMTDGSFFMLAVDGYGASSANDPYEIKGLAEEMYLIKLNADLEYVFARKIDFVRPDYDINRLMAYDLAEGSDGDLAITGYIRSQNIGGGLEFDAFVVETDQLVNFRNALFFDFAHTERAVGMAIHPFSGGYVIAGTSWDESFIHAVDNDLNTNGTSIFVSASSNEMYAIHQELNFFFFGGTAPNVSLVKKQGVNLNCCEIESEIRELDDVFVEIESVPTGFSRQDEDETLMPNFTVRDFDNTSIVNCPTMAPLSVSEPEQSNELFEVYPNPASGELNVRFDDYAPGDRLELYSPDGQFMMDVVVSQNVSTLDISSLSSGIYVMVLNHEQEMYRKKIVVN